MNLSSATAIALVVTLAVGAVVALQPPLNAELGRRTSDLAAAFVSAGVTFIVLAALLLVFGDPATLGKLGGVPIGYLAGGVCGAAFVGASLVTVRYLGATGVVAATIAAQLTVAAILDALGLIGLDRTPLTPLRLLGIAALVVGVVLTTTK